MAGNNDWDAAVTYGRGGLWIAFECQEIIAGEFNVNARLVGAIINEYVRSRGWREPDDGFFRSQYREVGTI